MKIKKILIKGNCSSFADGANIEFDDNKVNVIYGPNGTGKTNLSKIFRLLSNNVDIARKREIYSNLKKLTSTSDMEILCNIGSEEKSRKYNRLKVNLESVCLIQIILTQRYKQLILLIILLK